MEAKHEEALKHFYASLTEGNTQKAVEGCAENFSFQVSGKSAVAGKYTSANFGDFMAKLKSSTDGTYQLQVHDILTSALHGTVMATEKFTKNGKVSEFRVVHVWRFENQKPLAGYAYERDLYAFDEAFR